MRFSGVMDDNESETTLNPGIATTQQHDFQSKHSSTGDIIAV